MRQSARQASPRAQSSALLVPLSIYLSLAGSTINHSISIRSRRQPAPVSCCCCCSLSLSLSVSGFFSFMPLFVSPCFHCLVNISFRLQSEALSSKTAATCKERNMQRRNVQLVVISHRPASCSLERSKNEKCFQHFFAIVRARRVGKN